MKPYLCGPIFGLADAEAKDWREEAKRAFPDALDPMQRDFRGMEDIHYREIVELDKKDVAACDLLIVYYPGPSAGTLMEMAEAWSLGKPIIVWYRHTKPVSPWVRYHATAIVDTLEDAIAAAREALA